ncbi:MarR family winged helix-turn-helix transcriptional regulator [Aeromonas molluscorum]|jgi:MarR family transcriptional regulator, organic hydroperoxide resistance regulator|uniref:MarR family transcriptional regulator n=1 Tax=Aeromonas molluscorum 848 TaxID=1268236 RepID=R1F3F1_9GAMM|nr:MarR family transcriptional regulator [Aeromonas molluscorum]EOD54433.1 MarR family transcriptional regulator [Aeromonas molluscorum 848]
MSELKKQVCFALYSASNAVMRAYRPLLDRLDLTYTQYLVMLSLWAEDGVSLKQIGQDTGLDAGTLTPIVKRLESKGWLTRTVSAEDERQKCVVLTDTGRALQAEVRASCLADNLRNQVDLNDAELTQLKGLCDRISSQLGR